MDLLDALIEAAQTCSEIFFLSAVKEHILVELL